MGRTHRIEVTTRASMPVLAVPDDVEALLKSIEAILTIGKTRRVQALELRLRNPVVLRGIGEATQASHPDAGIPSVLPVAPCGSEEAAEAYPGREVCVLLILHGDVSSENARDIPGRGVPRAGWQGGVEA